MTTTLTPAQVQAHLDAFLQELLAEWETDRATQRAKSDMILDMYAEGLEVSIDEVQEALVRNDQSVIEPHLDKYLTSKGITLAKDSTEYRLMGRGVLRNMLEALRIDQRRHQGDYSDPYARMAPQPLPVASYAPPMEHVDRTLLSEAAERYITIKSLIWKTSSKKDIPPHLRDFVMMVGDRETRSLTREHMRAFHSIMHHIPKRRSTDARYKGKSLAQLIDMVIPEADKLGAKTLDTIFVNVRSFINWLEKEPLLHRDRPAKHLNDVLKVRRKQKAAEKRRGFTEPELQALFHPDHFKPEGFNNSWQLWVPLMALTTGARIEEICQLHHADIKQDDTSGLWYFDLNAEDEKDIKTEAGTRQVPVHPALIELGLLDRVANLKKRKGTVRLFPTLNSRSSTGKLSGAVTQWFTRYRRSCGLGASTGETSSLTFHSFRHSFITRCKLTPGIDRRMVKEMVGHEQGAFDDITAGYAGRYPVKTLHQEVMAKLDFSGIVDLPRLKGTKWIEKA